MSRIATMKDVARAAGVSAMTVSRAFKKDASVKPATREAILQAADDLGYVYDSTAATLRSQKTGFVAVLIPSLNNANFADTVGGLSPVLADHGLQVLLGYTNYDVREEERLVEQLLRRRPEAIVLTGGHHTDRTRRLLKTAGIPVVETWDLPHDPIDRVVGFSNAGTMQAMVEHIVATGRRKIAFIGGDTDGDTRGADRRSGFQSAMESAGLAPHALIGPGAPPVSMREGSEAMAHLLADHPGAEAVICVSDLAAFGALAECRRNGIRVPHDIAVAGFGAYEIAEICVPRLTTIDPSPQTIGAEAARLIVALLRGDNQPATFRIKPQLVASESTALPT